MALRVFKDIPAGLRFGIFDFDNGAVNTEDVFAVFDCGLLNDVLIRCGCTPDLTHQDIRRLAGNGGDEKLRIIARQKGFDPAPHMENFIAQRTRERQTLFRKHSAPLSPGLEDLLFHLGLRCALATNKKEAKLFPDLEAMGYRDLFDVIVTSDDLNKKPAPDVILKALMLLNAPPECSVYFGDTVNDILAAVSAGVVPVGFIIEGLEGNGERIEKMRAAGAIAVSDDYRDFLPYFESA